MYKYGLQILGIVDTLNDWNEKLSGLASKYMDNVGVGILLIGGALFISFLGINALNKK